MSISVTAPAARASAASSSSTFADSSATFVPALERGDRAGDAEAVDARHPYVGERERRSELAAERDRLVAVAGRADAREALDVLDELDERGAEDVVVVDDDHRDRAGYGNLRSRCGKATFRSRAGLGSVGR